jgi:type II secretory ATPase GspE/PulE/Tfp pilus assembly ATPase PilB-like protein
MNRPSKGLDIMNQTRQNPSVLHGIEPEALAGVFEERAENLSREELQAWTAETSRDRALLTKLKGAGAKLLSGPRGSGKSTLLRKAW